MAREKRKVKAGTCVVLHGEKKRKKTRCFCAFLRFDNHHATRATETRRISNIGRSKKKKIFYRSSRKSENLPSRRGNLTVSQSGILSI